MTRLLPVLIAALLVIAFLVLRHEHHNLAAVPSGPFGRSDVATRAVRTVPPVAPKSHRPPRPRHHNACTDTHWRRVLKPAERWIDQRESGLNPASVEPTTGAYGLGQLLPSTYAALGLPMDPSPCRQIAAQRAYMAERYGNWHNALAHWKSVAWW